MLLGSKTISKSINLFILNFISIIHDFLQPMVNNMIGSTNMFYQGIYDN